MTLYLLRHAQTEWNGTGHLCGRADVPLSALGRQQALVLADVLKQEGIRFDRIAASPLMRAVQTASLVSGVNEASIERDPRLLEMDFGPYDGRGLRELTPDIYAWMSDPLAHDSPAGMETMDSFQQRTKAFIDQARQDSSNQKILAVTHGVCQKMILETLLSNQCRQIWGISIPNLALYQIDWPGGKVRITPVYPAQLKEDEFALTRDDRND